MQIKLTTTGRKTGMERTTTLYAWEHDEDLIVVGSWGGRPRDPAWAGNLRAEPTATVNHGKQRYEVTARELDGRERELAWDLVVDRFPLYGSYQRKTERRIPLFALRRR
jgi:deazaflavin-dependent oxidoreductase (nitroreductase family)